MVIVRHTFKDYNKFGSRVADSLGALTPQKGFKYIKTYSAFPLKNEAWCIWDVVNPSDIPNFQKEFSTGLGEDGTAEVTWVTEFTPETFPPFQYMPKK